MSLHENQSASQSQDKDNDVRSASHGQVSDKPTSPHTPQSRCHILISEILRDAGRCALISELSEHDAQAMANYLDTVSRDTNILGASNRRRALALLCSLVKSAQVFPNTYRLTGVECSTSEPVGTGGFADVYLGKYKNQTVCLKALRVFQKPQENERIIKTRAPELTLWAHLRHENILPFYGVCPLGATSTRLCLVSPWMKQGNLRDYMKEFPEKPRMVFISDILNGLSYLHGLQVVHNDLKAENILVSDDGHALIADFSSSSIAATSQLKSITSIGGTTHWRAPELFTITGDPQATKSCDIWSFACLCYEVETFCPTSCDQPLNIPKILTNKVPYHQYNPVGVILAMMKKEIPLRPTPGDGSEINDQLWDLLVTCWDYTPEDRPSCEKLQSSLKDLGIQEDQLPRAGAEVNPTFERQRESSGAKVDYVHVEEILLRISQSPHSGATQAGNGPESSVELQLPPMPKPKQPPLSPRNSTQSYAKQSSTSRHQRNSHSESNNHLSGVGDIGRSTFGVDIVETSQVKVGIRIQKARSTRGVGWGAWPGITNIPTDINDVPCKNLDGRVWRLNVNIHPNHSGGAADVFIGFFIGDSKMRVTVAIKVLRITRDVDMVEKIRKYLIRETMVWQNLHHPNVLPFLGLSYDHGRFGCPALIAPYCKRGALDHFLRLVPEIGTRLFIIRGVSEALRYLHDQDVVHGDLKPSNVLIHDDGHPLLCDFGRSKILGQRGFTTKPAGACRYQAPELLQGIGPNKATDVYAFAMLSYEIWTGLHPFYDIHQDTTIILNIIMKDARPKYPDPEPLGTEFLWEIFEGCWKKEPEERLGIEVVIQELAKITIPPS